MTGKIKRAISKLAYKIFPLPSSTSFSQAGEDAIVDFLFFDYGITHPTYLDVGTNFPDKYNNTFRFYQRGCTGVCVEADSTLIPAIKKKRSRDKVIHAGVSVTEMTQADFYIFNHKGINTFSKTEAEQRAKSPENKILKIAKVDLVSINQIIADHFDTHPHFLSLDIEGLDLQVLQSLNFNKYPIPVLCVETCTFSNNHIRPKDASVANYLGTVGYEVYADTYINTIFVNKNWFYNWPKQ